MLARVRYAAACCGITHPSVCEFMKILSLIGRFKYFSEFPFGRELELASSPLAGIMRLSN